MVGKNCSGHGHLNESRCVCDLEWIGQDELHNWNDCHISVKALEIVYLSAISLSVVLIWRVITVLYNLNTAQQSKGIASIGAVRALHVSQLAFGAASVVRLVYGVFFSYRVWQLQLVPTILEWVSASSFVSSILLLPVAWYAVAIPRRGRGNSSLLASEDGLPIPLYIHNTITKSPSLYEVLVAYGTRWCCCLGVLLEHVWLPTALVWMSLGVCLLLPLILESQEQGKGMEIIDLCAYVFSITLVLSFFISISVFVALRLRILAVLEVLNLAPTGRKEMPRVGSRLSLQTQPTQGLERAVGRVKCSTQVAVGFAFGALLGFSSLHFCPYLSRRSTYCFGALSLLANLYLLLETEATMTSWVRTKVVSQYKYESPRPSAFLPQDDTYENTETTTVTATSK